MRERAAVDHPAPEAGLPLANVAPTRALVLAARMLASRRRGHGPARTDRFLRRLEPGQGQLARGRPKQLRLCAAITDTAERDLEVCPEAPAHLRPTMLRLEESGRDLQHEMAIRNELARATASRSFGVIAPARTARTITSKPRSPTRSRRNTPRAAPRRSRQALQRSRWATIEQSRTRNERALASRSVNWLRETP